MIDKTNSIEMDVNNIEKLISSIYSDNTIFHKNKIFNKNIKIIKDYFKYEYLKLKQKNFDEDFKLIKYTKDEEIVTLGSISSDKLKNDSNFNYSYVPLGLIVKGNVVVIKGGKATKKLGVGDFIGLFETSDWILTKKSREIGDWTLITNNDAEILFFGASILKKNSKKTEDLRNYLVELSRSDYVSQPITKLQLLDWVASHITESRLSDFIIIIHTHILPNNLPFFRHLSYLVNFGQIYILEKPYSTVKKSYKELVYSGYEIIPVKMEKGMPYEFSVQKSLEILWKKINEEQKQNGFKNILIIDDGGDVLTSIPWEAFKGIRIVGVEQTQRGITRINNSGLRTPPIVSVATSGIKKLVESEFIGYSVFNKLKSIGVIKSAKKIGILGMGSIGSAIYNSLKTINHNVIYYDPDVKLAKFSCDSIDQLINESDLIIGTTGGDSLKGIALERISGHKIFVSASSADIEFGSLLKLSSSIDKFFDTLRIKIHDKLTLEILNGGFPINFDRKSDATPDEDIVLTRCLLYIGAMQAVELLKEDKLVSGIYNLDSSSQKYTLEKWINTKIKLGHTPHISINDIQKIINFNFLENGKVMSSIWKK